ncbi:MAG: peptide-methionine (R)-S-oxide reductase MsrB [Bdellovibrionaceae bacterium]|nr:peptide-methionine (R)-S-oxide reductase MsrB [Pseudobdellovibrionaceae bacterium]
MKYIVTLIFISACLAQSKQDKQNQKDQKYTKDANVVKNIVESSKSKKKDGEICELPKNDAELRKLLSPEQYKITKENGTEKPFDNKYWDNKHPGIYVDVISNEALFSSKDKFDSGSGWPSFTKPIKQERIVEKQDVSHGMSRVEVRSSKADSHLGHVFNDGPTGSTGLRYCINSASLKFIPLEKMEEMGFDKFLNLFDQKDWEKAHKSPYKN